MAAAGLRFSFGAVRHRPTAARRVQRLLKKFCQAAGANPQVGYTAEKYVKPQKTIRGYDGSFGGTIASAGFSMQATFQHEYQEPRGRLHWPRLRMHIRYALFPTTLHKAVPEPAEIKQCREDRAYTPCNRNRPALSRCDRPWFGVCRSAGCGPTCARESRGHEPEIVPNSSDP